MRISEIFHSIQGEGIYTGRWATFVRFAGCNLRCRWCDTKYAWDLEQAFDMGVEEVVRQIRKDGPNRVIFTGGEPLLYQNSIYDICELFLERSTLTSEELRFGVETNGTKLLDVHLAGMIDHVVVSPKLKSACRSGYLIETLEEWVVWAGESPIEFKFVVCNSADLKEVEWIIEKLRLRQTNIPVVLQPNGQRRNYSKAARELVNLVRESSLHNYTRVMLQSHRVIWGGERGK